MKTLQDYTPEIKAKVPEYIEKYTKGVFDGGRYNDFKKEDAEALINWNYEKCGYKKPIVLVAENIYESQIFFNYIVANKEVFTPIIYLLYCLKNNIDIPPGLKISDSQLRSQLRSQLYSPLYSQLYSQLRSPLYSQLDSQLDSQLGKYNTDYLFTSNVWSSGIIAWYKFIKDEFNLESQIGVELDSWGNLYDKSGVYSVIFSELICVVSKYPKKVHRNANNDLHNTEGPAVEWGTSTELTKFEGYYINGRNIPEDVFNAVASKKYTSEAFFKESNEEIKSSVIALIQEKFGEEYLFEYLRKELKEIATYADKKEDKFMEGTTKSMNVGVYTLFKGTINRENVAYVRCYCPSTDRMFFLGVDPKHDNPKDAIASLYRVPKKLAKNIKYIQRQGERFSTVFDDAGQDILKSLSQADIQNSTSITGEEYFSKMRYEF